MRLFGWEITATRADREKALVPSRSRSVWHSLGRVSEPFTGAWQRNIEADRETVLSFHAVFACTTLIASDIAKCRLKLVERTQDGIWRETESPAFSPVLRKQNSYQSRINFVESWILSKLTRGNTYVLKERDNRGVVTGLHVLNPDLVQPLVSDSGDVFYSLGRDNLARLDAQQTVPAREIIHDRFNCLHHPLVGLSPIMAGGLAATQGLSIQKNSALFFANGSRAGGLITAPEKIPDEVAHRIKQHWDNDFTGANAGKVAVLGDGMEYRPLAMPAQDAQLIEQLKWSAQTVCSTYHMPPYKIGVGDLPSYNNVQALNVEYYSQCLQSLIESLELCLDEGLGIGERVGLGVELDLENLLRMDTAGLMGALKSAVDGGIMAPNEARRRLDLAPVEGGDQPYLQQQNYPLSDLAARPRAALEPLEPS